MKKSTGQTKCLPHFYWTKSIFEFN